MKKKILFFSTWIIFTLFAGCTKDKADVLDINEEYFDFLGVDGDGGSFYVTSNTKWTVSSSDSWIKFSPESGKGNMGVVVSVKYNSAPNIRTGSVKVSTPGGITRTALVAQLGTAPAIIARAVRQPLSGKDSINVRVTATHDWEAVIPSDAQKWIRWRKLHPTDIVGWARLVFDWNETDITRTEDVTFKLKNGNAQTIVSVTQPFIIPPSNIKLPEEAVKGLTFTIEGKNLGSVEKVYFDETEVTILEKTDTYVTVLVPASFSDATYALKIIYGSREMSLGQMEVIPPFPKVAEIPATAAIGTAFILHGSMFSTISKIFLGTTEVQFTRGRTPDRSMLVTVPATAKPGEVDLKFTYTGGLETVPGTIELVNYAGGDPTKDLCRYAGSKYPNVPRVAEGGRTNGFNTGNGRAVLFAFDGALDAASNPGATFYDTHYTGQTNWNGTAFGTTVVGGNPGTAQSFWQANSGQIQGEVNDGVAINQSGGLTYFMLDYTWTPAGRVTFDKIELIGRGAAADVTQAYTVEISDNALHWIKVVKAEDSKELSGTSVFTHNLSTIVTAKYVRYAVTKAGAGNTGLRKFELYCTK